MMSLGPALVLLVVVSMIVFCVWLGMLEVDEQGELVRYKARSAYPDSASPDGDVFKPRTEATEWTALDDHQLNRLLSEST